jgi:4-diphosphocytidyl-2-C-methyl-D-erythritol kinase
MTTHNTTTRNMTTRIEAPAKLTLSLRVTGVRDDGYHLINAEMVSLDICDVITLAPSESPSLSITGPHASGISTGSDNLVMRALALTHRSANISVEKNIPAGGGLGGGSTDAAAILRWAGFGDLGRAAAIGADIPFCMIGGRAQVEGIGEIVAPLPYQHQDITLIIPPLHVSTPAVYRMWDEMGGPRHESCNDLEPAAIAVEPRLAKWKDIITEACAMTPTLAGSGATWFVTGHHKALKTSHNSALHDAKIVFTSTRRDAGSVSVEP